MVLRKNRPNQKTVRSVLQEPLKSSTIEESSVMPIVDHLNDLRERLLKSFFVFMVASVCCYIFSKDILDFLIKPLAQMMPYKIGRHLIYTDLSEAFLTHLKIACYAGLGIAFPFISFQLWGFIAPGLYKHEKNLCIPLLIFSPLLFIAGMALVYYGIFPLAWEFFLSFQESPSLASTFSPTALPLEIEPRISSYLNLSLSLMTVFGICFQLPLVLGMLARFKMIRSAHLRQYRRHAIVGIFILSAIVTPPDVLSQLLLAVPLIGLYEVSILIIRFFTPSS